MSEPINEKLIADIIVKLREFNESKIYNDSVMDSLNTLKDELNKGIEYKVLAGKKIINN